MGKTQRMFLGMRVRCHDGASGIMSAVGRKGFDKRGNTRLEGSPRQLDANDACRSDEDLAIGKAQGPTCGLSRLARDGQARFAGRRIGVTGVEKHSTRLVIHEQLAIELHGGGAEDVSREHAAGNRVGSVGYHERGIEPLGILAKTGMHAGCPETRRRRDTALVIGEFDIDHGYTTGQLYARPAVSSNPQTMFAAWTA